MLLYHGSNLIVEKPRLVEQTRNHDFGAGFYCTTNREQAASFSIKVCERILAKGGADSGKPIVSVYEFDEAAALKALSVKQFFKADKMWLAFVAANRRGIYDGTSYDLVIGKVANDNVFPNILAYLSGLQSSDVTVRELRVKQLFDRYTFKTENALTFLSFAATYQHEGGR